MKRRLPNGMGKVPDSRHTYGVDARFPCAFPPFVGVALNPRAFPTISLGIACGLALAAPARADVRLEVHEASWSAGQTPVTVETLVRTWIRGGARRIENQLTGQVSDSAVAATRFVQIDRLDRDSSYFVRPLERAYIPIAYAGSRSQNEARARVLRQARASGAAPRDTLPPVVVKDLPGTRTFGGVVCRGKVLELTFAYRDTALTAGTDLVGVLSDTVWFAPPGSPLEEVGRFDRALARATAADSLLTAGNAVQIAQQRGLGLVAVLQRTLRGLPGGVVASHFVNLLRGLPRGLAGVERLPDGSAVVQRTVRTPLLVATDPLPDSLFTPPAGFRRAERGARAGRGEKAPPPP
jgi:hypothetical protein